MSTVMIAADASAIDGRYTHPARAAVPVKESASLLQRAQGIASGLLFLGVRVPLYLAVLLCGMLVSLAGVVLYGIQAICSRLTRPAGTAAATALALVSIAGPQRARADMLTGTEKPLLGQTTMVFGQQTTLDSFDAPGAGTLTLTLKDWGFPVPLQQLTASILSNDQVLGSVDPIESGKWRLEVPIQSSGIFDAFVAAQSGSYDHLSIGAYSISVSFEPGAATVPLPPALDLLLGGIGLLGAVTLVERLSRRRNTDVISIA